MSFLSLPSPIPPTLTIEQVREIGEEYVKFYADAHMPDFAERPPVVVQFHDPHCSYLLASDSSHYLLATVAGQPCH